MFSELLKRCLLGDRIASTQLFLQIYLHQVLEDLFKRLGLEPRLMIIPTPQPGAPCFEMGKALHEKNFLNAMKELRHLQPPLIAKEIQIEAIEKIYTELESLLEALKREELRLKAEMSKNK